MVRNLVNTGNPVFPLAYRVFGAKAGTWDAELNNRWQRVHASSDAEQTGPPFALRALYRTAGDFRMGAAVFLLAGAGALRRRDRETAWLVAMLLWQVAVWGVATHLFARFAVVMLLPTIALAARALEGECAQGDTFPRWLMPGGLVLILLAACGAWNLYRLGGLYYDHTRLPDGQQVEAYGHTDWFVHGEWPGTAHLGVINALGDDVYLMMVGEARSFYVRPPCEYAVVFNRHPLARAWRRLGSGAAVMDWLRERGTTHLFVHWGEITRLRSTYGYEPDINAELFAELAAAGLTEVQAFFLPDKALPYATLYQVR
jgi:hypothetical protein